MATPTLPFKLDTQMNLTSCNRPGCSNPKARSHLLCRSCWALVPKQHRHAVNRAYAIWSKSPNPENLERLREAQTRAVMVVM